MTPPGLIVSAPASGTGKTTLMLGLLAAFRAAGVASHPFKSGPDYIDPGFHRAASGRASVNLDTWAMSAEMIAGLIGGAEGSDLILAEGSMGLFDGVVKDGASGNGASASLAAMTGWPVVLVLDTSGQAQSAAAVAKGFAEMQAGVDLAGVVLNRVASPRHEAMLRAGMESVGIPVLGALPRSKDIEMPSRHLGLVQADDQEGLEGILQAAGDFVAAHVDLEMLRSAAKASQGADAPPHSLNPPGNRIAMAKDAAFSFAYPHLIQSWQRQGAAILPFSPLADQAPDPSADICWLPGGYPELHAGALAASRTFMTGLRDFAKSKPVHGECGGYMAMGEVLIDKDGNRHQMAGLVGLVTSYEKRKMHLGYRAASLKAPMLGHAKGALLRGHEFHYSTILDEPDQPLAEVRDAGGDLTPETGSVRGNATGTFFHLISEAL